MILSTKATIDNLQACPLGWIVWMARLRTRGVFRQWHYGLLVDSEGVTLLLPTTNGGLLLARWLATVKHHDWLG